MLPNAAVTQGQQEYSERCLFLELPIDVRLVIYKLLLTGRTLHIQNDSDPSSSAKRKATVCTNPQQDDRCFVRDVSFHHISSGNASLLHYHAAKCSSQDVPLQRGPSRPVLQLQILQTCRRVHQEASLLPFQGNSFTASNLESLLIFQNGLETFQANAIRSLTIYQERGWKGPGFGLDPFAIVHLTGLQDLRLYVKLSASNKRGVRQELPWHETGEDKLITTLELVISLAPGLKNVQIAVADFKWSADTRREWNMLSQQELMAWAEKTRIMLLSIAAQNRGVPARA